MTRKNKVEKEQDAVDHQVAAVRVKLEADMYDTIIGLDPGSVLMVGGIRVTRGAITERIKLKNPHVRHLTGQINRRKKLKNWTSEFENRVQSTVSSKEPDYLVRYLFVFLLFPLNPNNDYL